MKTTSLTLATLITIGSGASLLALTPSLAPVAPVTSSSEWQPMAFRDSAEAGMMHSAYHTLATGDHDYHGHRIGAMKEIKKAADLLGVDLSGDDRDHEKQVLSDDKLREARDQLNHVLGASGVKDQDRIAKHIREAIHEIDKALAEH